MIYKLNLLHFSKYLFIVIEFKEAYAPHQTIEYLLWKIFIIFDNCKRVFVTALLLSFKLRAQELKLKLNLLNGISCYFS